jgi:hypothetical protein
MHYARKCESNEIVEASQSLTRGNDYSCPTCGGRVRLHKGPILDPYFAHLENEGSPDCDEYYPGWGATYSQPTVPREVEDSQGETGLCLDDSEDAWSIYLRLPEIPVHEFRTEALGTLKQAQVEIRTGGVAIATLSALELCPGVGAARVCVPLSSNQYQFHPTGTWPNGITLERWRNPSAGLSEFGVLFRFRRGEWVRLRSGSSVEWGEALCVVAKCNEVLPTSCTPTLVKGTIPGWKLWHVQLPTVSVAAVERWLERLGHSVCLPEPHLQFLTVPSAVNLGTRVAGFEQSVPLVARVVTSQPGEKTVVTLKYGSNRFLATTCSELGSKEGFFQISAGRLGAYSIEINGYLESVEEFDCLIPMHVEQLRRLLAGVPRLKLSIGATTFETWTDCTSTLTIDARTAIPDVHLDLGTHSARLDLFVQSKTSRRTRLQISLQEAERIIASELSQRQPFLLRVDAGAQGSLNVDIATSDTRRGAKPKNRIGAWLARASAEGDASEKGLSWSLEGNSELLTTSVRVTGAALRAQLRTAAWRIRHNRSRSNR